MKRIAVLISGGGTNLQALIDAIENQYIKAEITIVLSNRKNAYGLERAKKHGISNLFISKKDCGSDLNFNRKIIDVLNSQSIDLVVLAGYLSILSCEFIEAFRNRIINIHPALIPAFCGEGFYGEKVHQAVIDYGAKVSGATVHFVDEGTDTGAIILQESLQVFDNDTAESLQKRILCIEHKLLPEAVKLFCENRLKLVKSQTGRNCVRILEIEK